MAKLKAAEDTMAGAVSTTLDELKPGPLHAATALLARRYAQLIDDAEDLAEAMDEYGPRLFACLESLGAATAPTGGAAGVTPPRKGLAELRSSRRPR
jgi:hypothetical protein